MKVIQALEDSNILLKGITKTIENETKEQKWGFLGMLLGTLGASLLRNMLRVNSFTELVMEINIFILKSFFGSTAPFNKF